MVHPRTLDLCAAKINHQLQGSTNYWLICEEMQTSLNKREGKSPNQTKHPWCKYQKNMMFFLIPQEWSGTFFPCFFLLVLLVVFQICQVTKLAQNLLPEHLASTSLFGWIFGSVAQRNVSVETFLEAYRHDSSRCFWEIFFWRDDKWGQFVLGK